MIDIEVKIGETYYPLEHDCYYPLCQGTFDQCTFQEPCSDSRLSNKPKHELGVVLQPSYYLADWQNVLQFFESWLAHGASKFFVYHYSWSRQVELVVEFYKRTVNVEVLPWSSFPVKKNYTGYFQKDPNTLAFNLVSEAALNNALYRARGRVKFLAMMDIDEVVWSEKALIPFLRELGKEHTNGAQFSFSWIHHSAQIPLTQLEEPADVDFDYLNELQPITKQLDPIYFSRTSRKVIHIVNKVQLVDTHNALKNFIDPETEEEYTTVMVNPEQAKCIHMRRIFDNISQEKEKISSLLAEFAFVLNQNYSKRIKNTTFSEFHMNPWFLEYRNTITTLHGCRAVTRLKQVNSGRGGLSECRSIRGCEEFIQGKENFIFSPNSWTDLDGSL